MNQLFPVGTKVRLNPALNISFPDPHYVGFVEAMFRAAKKGQVFTVARFYQDRKSYQFDEACDGYGNFSYAEGWIISCDPNWHPPTKEEELIVKVKQLWGRQVEKGIVTGGTQGGDGRCLTSSR